MIGKFTNYILVTGRNHQLLQNIAIYFVAIRPLNKDRQVKIGIGEVIGYTKNEFWLGISDICHIAGLSNLTVIVNIEVLNISHFGVG